MNRRRDSLRPLSKEEEKILKELARSHSEPAGHVARAKVLLAVAEGLTYRAAASVAGRRSDDAVSRLVGRFNREGLAALEYHHAGGHRVEYGTEARERILAEARRKPDRARDGTATWSLTTLQRALRSAPDGLPRVSTFTVWKVLHEAGLSWQRTRSWCETGKVRRKRKSGVAEVVDPDALAKKKAHRAGVSIG